ncbi:MAG: UvrD-helicase domain-containing protein [bacterium]
MTKEQQVREESVRRDDYLSELNEAQRRAVEHTGSPLLILAGAGSGKTKALTYKAAHLVDTGKATPEQILLVTFTNKAAEEMRKRVEGVAGVRLPNVGTFHSMSARILRRDGQEIGISPEFVIYDASDQEDLVKTIVREREIDEKRFRPKAVLSSISEAKQEMLDPLKYNSLARGPFQEVVSAVYGEYQKRLKQYNALDFEDLLFKTVELWQKRKDILEKYREIFRHVFVDEYQDTNTTQYTLTKLIVGPRRQLTVVGDASQSIYKWRGADYRNILKLKQDYADLTEIRLEQNYRSTQTILDAAHNVINNNKSHPILALWTETGQGEKIKLIEAYSASDEAKRVTLEIGELRNSGYKWEEIVILYRTNAQSRALEEGLIRQSIPYVLVGGTKFYERKEVKDVLAYLRVMLNPEDEVSRKRAEKAGKRRLANLLVIRETFETSKHTTGEILDKILTETKYLEKYDEEVEEDFVRIENVKELLAVASEFPNLSEFLENVALVQSEYYAGEKAKSRKDKNTKTDAITLMTLHAAKGLEFRAVFLVGLEEGLFPHSRSMADKEEMEEERRLAYVGITRAKERLYLTYAKQRMVWGTGGAQIRSRFIDEIDASLMDIQLSPIIGLRKNEAGLDWIQAGIQTKRSGIRIDALTDSTLESFLSGELSVEELLDQ